MVEGGRDEFVVFLVIGIGILAIAAIFFGGAIDFGGLTAEKTHELSVENISRGSVVGLSDRHSSSVYSFGAFEAGFQSDTKEYVIGDRELKNGVLFGFSQIELRAEQENPSEGRITFTVVQTNGLEPLIVEVNGNKILNERLTPGDYSVNFQAERQNEIKILPASSSWQIWAPNQYELRDVRVSVDGLKEKADRFFFDIGDEYDTFSDGKIELIMDRAAGNMAVELNGNIIYDGPVEREQSIYFTKSDIRRGPNTLAIGGSGQSDFLGTARITVFHQLAELEKAEIPFVLTQKEIRDLVKVRISFDVISIEKQGGIAVSAFSGPDKVFEDFDRAEAKHYSFELTAKEITKQNNRLTIESVGGSKFRVDGLDVKIVLKGQRND